MQRPESGPEKGAEILTGLVPPEQWSRLKRHEDIIRFVYVWTIDWRASMGDYLDMGVDGIITNEIYDLMFLIKQPEYSQRLRPATRVDSPFARE